MDEIIDWAELSIKAIKLQKKRDHLLNLERYDDALKIHMQMEMVNFELTKLIGELKCVKC
jgi:hypothetical protein